MGRHSRPRSAGQRLAQGMTAPWLDYLKMLDERTDGRIGEALHAAAAERGSGDAIDVDQIVQPSKRSPLNALRLEHLLMRMKREIAEESAGSVRRNGIPTPVPTPTATMLAAKSFAR